MVWTDWDESAHRFGPLQRWTAKIAAADPHAGLAPGEIGLAPPLSGMPWGAAVGPEGMGVGMVTGAPNFAEWEVILNRVRPGPLHLSVHAEDTAGNVEKRPHELDIH